MVTVLYAYVFLFLQSTTSTWSLQSVWSTMSTLPRVAVGILLVLSVYSFGVMIDRALMYSAARKQSRVFVQQVAGPLKDGRLDEAIAIAERNKKSHIAKVVATGLSEFQFASQQVSDAEVVETAKRGLERSIAIVHGEMKRGLSALATIGSTAPFVGLFGAVVGILNAFKGIEISKATGFSAVDGGIAEALVTTAFGLLVAMPAVWAYYYFSRQLQTFDTEMSESSQLIDYFASLRSNHEWIPALAPSAEITLSAGVDFTRLLWELGSVQSIDNDVPATQENETNSAVSGRTNRDQIEGKWKQYSGNAKSRWGKLTDDDVRVLTENKDRLVSVVQERYGLAKDEALRQVDDFDKSLSNANAERSEGTNSRYLVARTNGSLKRGVRFQLMARISTENLQSGMGQGGTPVSHEVIGKLVISIYAPFFRFEDDSLQHEVDVPSTGNSPWVLFEPIPKRDGVQHIEVLAWKDSVQVGSVSISVAVGSAETSGEPVQSSVDMREPEKGEYTLEVVFDTLANRYRFQLRGDTGDLLPSMYDEALEVRKEAAYLNIISKLNEQARNANQLSEFAQGEWLKGMGGTLYNQLIPHDLKAALWENRDEIKYLNILSGTEPMPWELLYISDPEGSQGGQFIADTTTVTRWRYGPRPPKQISKRSAYFVLPNGSPSKAQAEVAYARDKLGSGQTIDQLDSLLELFKSGQFSLLHFASHNVAPAAGTNGLYIPFGRSKFDVTFMGAWSINQFRSHAPMVFMNACTSAGSTPLYTEMAGWADGFISAGCGAFIGSLWEIRDTSAFTFAQKFYDEVTGGRNLGESMRAARSVLKNSDPTYLAYTLYGNPLARLS